MTGENDRHGVLLDAESVSNIDYMWIDNVNAVLNKYDGKNGKSLWVKSMEVFQKMDGDPISMRHSDVNRDQSDEEDDIPFN